MSMPKLLGYFYAMLLEQVPKPIIFCSPISVEFLKRQIPNLELDSRNGHSAVPVTSVPLSRPSSCQLVCGSHLNARVHAALFLKVLILIMFTAVFPCIVCVL